MEKRRDRGAPVIAGWVQAFDAAAATLLALTILVWGYGGFRVGAGPISVSVTSPWRLAAFAALLMAIRHARMPTPSLAHRLLGGARRWWASPAFSAARPHWFASRLAVLFAGYVAIGTIGYAMPPERISENEFWNLPARGEALRMLSVAKFGYHPRPDQPAGNLDLFPAYPILMNVGGTLVGNRVYTGSVFLDPLAGKPLFAGMAISLAAFLFALSYLYGLARLDMDDGQARTAVALMASYPFAFIFSTPTESAVALLSATAAVYSMRMDRLVPAAGWGLLAGLTHWLGWIVSLLMVGLARVDRAGNAARPRARIAAALTPLAGTLMFSAFTYLSDGRPFPWLETSAADGAVALHGLLVAFHVMAGALAAVLTGLTLRRLPIAYVGYVVAVLLTLAARQPEQLGPGTALLFPTFLALGRLVPPGHRVGWVSAFALGQGLFAALFYTSRPVM